MVLLIVRAPLRRPSLSGTPTVTYTYSYDNLSIETRVPTVAVPEKPNKLLLTNRLNREILEVG